MDNADYVVFVLKGYPRLSETFIAQEILALERLGLNIVIFSLRHPTDKVNHPIHKEISAEVKYLPEYLYIEPLRLLRAWSKVHTLPGYRKARRVWLEDVRRDRTANRVRRFGQAIILAHEIPKLTSHIHAHFIHTPGSVTRYASLITNLTWSCSAHAKDIWTTPEWEKKEKLAECDWLATCTAANHLHLKALTDHPNKVKLIYHGLDLDRFPVDKQHSVQPGTNTNSTVRFISVGRAVDKKGYPDLLRGFAGLSPDIHWRLLHIGGGPELNNLKFLAQSLGISDQITWMGTQPQQEVLRCYRESDVFVLASRIGSDGDRDGLPNVLLEAQSQCLPVLSTNVSGIPELIENDVNGLLVPQRDINALSAGLAQLATEPTLRMRLGNAGYQRVHKEFSLEKNIGQLAKLFGL